MAHTYIDTLFEVYPNRTEYLDWIQYELDTRVYYFGNHFKTPFGHKRQLKYRIRNYLASFKRKVSNIDFDGAILSEAYANWGINDKLKEEGYKVCMLPWHADSGFRLSTEYAAVANGLDYGDFNFLLSEYFIDRVYNFRSFFENFLQCNHIKLVIFANDMTAINRIAISACKNVGVKSMIYLHGLPAGSYNAIDNNRADYLCVWGDRMKELCVNAGVNANKVIVMGNAKYSGQKFPDTHPASFDNVLVLSRAISGAPSDSVKRPIENRGLSIDYIYMVEEALKRVGVNKATLRLHPSENGEWYKKFIDSDFYTLDDKSLMDCLSDKTAIVSPASTVMFDAFLCGIPFFAFEPHTIIGYEVVPPFDGSEEEMPIAKSISELVDHLQHNIVASHALIDKYINPVVDMSKIKELLPNG